MSEFKNMSWYVTDAASASYYSHCLKIKKGEVWLYPTITSYFTMFLFFAVGAIFMLSTIASYFEDGIFYYDSDFIPDVLLSSIFAGIGATMYTLRSRAVFSKEKGLYQDKRKAFAKPDVELSNIQCLQLFKHRVKGSKGNGYKCYQLNIVMHNGDRVTVMNHGGKREIIRDAHLLSDYLEIPLVTRDI